eukprot:gene3900-4259_t
MKSFDLQSQKRSDQSAMMENAAGVMRQLWMTPIYSTNIFRLNENEIKNQKFLKDLETSVLTRYKQAQVNTEHGMNKVDNLYLIDQKEELLYKQCVTQNTTSCQPPYSFRYALIQLFYQEIVKFLQECGLQSNVVEMMPKNGLDIDLAFSIWASVHANGSYHLAHHHENSMVSGVLYAATPAGAGDFVANDPRGPLPPFGRSQHFTPQLGDMILFPGWLMHSVLPTLSSLPRVSISFNFIGRWDTTTDLNQGFFV